MKKNVKKDNNVTKKEKFITTKPKVNGGIEVEMPKSPSKTVTGKVFAIAIAVLTIGVPLASLIYLLIKAIINYYN